ncbi:MAG: hypothetical protein EA357_03615 [Micavibrio sp.]|nr:MAG: hypothetical protein EA357_03615 [Micavibrio sp.]
MSLFTLFSSPSVAFDVAQLPQPWNAERVAIYDFLKKNINSEIPNLLEEGGELPDDEEFYANEDIRWVAGGLDGAFGRHGGKNEQQKTAKEIFAALEKVVKNPTEENVSSFYKYLKDNSAIDFLDELLPLIAKTKSLDDERVQKFAKWLAESAPDREPVKAAIAILGIFPGEKNKELFTILGRHEEFTLYSAVAFNHSLENPEAELWDLAKHVNGWGKIQVVERLAETQNKDIKHWMLRDGYKNSIMYEYLAFICATTGGLLSELESPDPDESLLLGAGDIIKALTAGGPAEDMDDYVDGAKVTQLYLGHIADKTLNFEQFLVVKAIRDFAQDDGVNWADREDKGWTKNLRKEIAEKASTILSNPDWIERVVTALNDEVDSQEYAPFHTIALVAETLGIDTWDYYYTRQKSGYSDEWYYLMQTKDEKRIDKVIALAEQTIPLDQVATGPAQEMGMGPEFKHHSALDFILQDLRRFPGKGWKLVKSGLRSPVIRNRNMSLMALSNWGRENWPDDAENILQEALKNEPDGDVKVTIQKVLNEEPID